MVRDGHAASFMKELGKEHRAVGRSRWDRDKMKSNIILKSPDRSQPDSGLSQILTLGKLRKKKGQITI